MDKDPGVVWAAVVAIRGAAVRLRSDFFDLRRFLVKLTLRCVFFCFDVLLCIICVAMFFVFVI